MGTDDGWMGGRGPTVGFVSRLQRNRVYFHPHATMKRSANTVQTTHRQAGLVPASQSIGTAVTITLGPNKRKNPTTVSAAYQILLYFIAVRSIASNQ
jgi:hypothetical protein